MANSIVQVAQRIESFIEEYFPPRARLRGKPQLSQQDSAKLQKDFDDFRDGLPWPIESHVLSNYGISLKSKYGGQLFAGLAGRVIAGYLAYRFEKKNVMVTLGKLLAVIIMANSLGQWIGPWAARLILDATHSYNIAWAAVSIGGVLGALLIYSIKVEREQVGATA